MSKISLLRKLKECYRRKITVKVCNVRDKIYKEIDELKKERREKYAELLEKKLYTKLEVLDVYGIYVMGNLDRFEGIRVELNGPEILKIEKKYTGKIKALKEKINKLKELEKKLYNKLDDWEVEQLMKMAKKDFKFEPFEFEVVI